MYSARAGGADRGVGEGQADAENQGESKERNGGTGREGHNGKAQRPDQVTKDTELMGLRWAWVWM